MVDLGRWIGSLVSVGPQGQLVRDGWAGLVAGALLIPQAMGFGMMLWQPIGISAATAAASGLLAAAFLSLSSGLSRGTLGMVSAPTGPTLVLLSGLVSALYAYDPDPAALITGVLATIFLAGTFQVVMALLRLGHLVKFIPYPVVSGFMTGTGLLMLESQWPHVLGDGADLTMSEGGWVPAATVAITLFCTHWAQKRDLPIPGPVVGLVAGMAFFHLMAMDMVVPSSWFVGRLPGLEAPGLAISWIQLPSISWELVLPSAMALAVLASLDTLLTSVVADLSTGSRHSSRRELLGQGCGHMMSALSGGMAGAGTTGATLAAIQSGGSRYAALMAAGVIALAFLLAGRGAAWLPVSVLSGIIIHIALFNLLDRDILLWLKTRRARMDALIALVVTGVTLWLDLMSAVGLGIALAMIEFIRTQAQSAIIRQRWNLHERSSMRRRREGERQALAEHAESVVGYTLQGNLFFGTADHLLEKIMPDLNRADFIILDMRRLHQVDLTGLRLIEHMCGIMRERGAELLLAHPPKSMGLVKRKGHRHERLMPYHEHVRLRTFADADAALEYAEDHLLERLGFALLEADAAIPLGESSLLQGFSREERQILEGYFEIRSYPAGVPLFQTGDPGDTLYVLLRGDVEIRIPGKRKRRKRIVVTRYGPGMAFGEVAFLNPGPRTADAIVVRASELALISNRSLQRLCRKHATLGMRLLMALGHEISRDLRAADSRIRHLVED